MIIIAHRGNIHGPNSQEENTVSYIGNTLKDFDVEIDIWKLNDDLYLGHDAPLEKIESSFLMYNQEKLWIHCKNIESFHFCLEKGLKCFFHDTDDCTLTSNSIIWTYPGKLLTNRSIAVMPENVHYSIEELSSCLGICTDWPKIYRELYV